VCRPGTGGLPAAASGSQCGSAEHEGLPLTRLVDLIAMTVAFHDGLSQP
jgi:hypothetical protein